MKRGEVWWINFDPAVGGEVRKVRPAIISSNNASNASLNRVQVAPITSSIDNLYPSEAYITHLTQSLLPGVENPRLDKTSVFQTHTASK